MHIIVYLDRFQRNEEDFDLYLNLGDRLAVVLVRGNPWVIGSPTWHHIKKPSRSVGVRHLWRKTANNYATDSTEMFHLSTDFIPPNKRHDKQEKNDVNTQTGTR